MVSTLTDITQTVKAGLAARQSQELFATAFRLSPINMNISRLSDGVFMAVNAASQSVQGYTPAELLGRSALDMGMWPSRQLREAFMLRLQTEEGMVSTEIAMRHKDGHMVQCCVWAARSQIAGQPCVLSCMMNVTEQKQREALLLNLAHGLSGQSGDSFFNSITRYLGDAIEADMVLVGEIVADKHVRSLSLLMDGHIMGGLSYPLAGTPCDRVRVSKDLCIYGDNVQRQFPDDGLLTEGGFKAYIGVALRDADGTPIGIVSALWRSAQPQSGDREALVRIFASLTNAELVRLQREREIEILHNTLEQRVRERTDQLESTNAELESFGYSVSHDLQSPLRSIQGFVFLLDKRLKGRLSSEEDRLFDRVKANVLRMHELISDLLALARVSRDRLTLKTVDLSKLARQVALQERQRDPQREVELVIARNIESVCDPKFARIVLENLLGNAWKYARKQAHARIEFGVLPDLVEGRQVLFVRDNGAGFNMAYSASLFKPFHRLHHESEFEGSGIGLATVHRILERHGGTISAEAAEGVGACFYFSFDRGPGTAPA
jgi:PAS domain S-box-containing protein